MPTATVATARPGVDFEVGTSIPPATPHAVSVSLPKWQDNVDYEEGRLAEVMQTGYPRFFIHRSIQKLASILLARFGQRSTGTSGGNDVEAEACILVPSRKVARSCKAFMQDHYTKQQSESGTTGKYTTLPLRSVQVCLTLPTSSTSTPPITSEDSALAKLSSSTGSLNSSTVLDDCSSPQSKISIHIVLFPQSCFPIAKTFWQHTGDGISSRMAEVYLELLERREKVTSADGVSSSAGGSAGNVGSPNGNGSEPKSDSAYTKPRSYARNRHYSRNNSAAGLHASAILSASSTPATPTTEEPVDSNYLEERYGRNMATIEAPRAKRALRKRIAGVASNDVVEACESESTNGHSQSHSNPDIIERAQGTQLSENDVYLYPTGMSAIFHAHQLALGLKQEKSVCFGFPYLDTLKILQKWGPGCFFLGHGDVADLERLENLLKGGQKITALFCEFPSNPLLRSPNLVKLRKLADEYDFLIVIDETVGNFINVEVMPYADIVVSSLTKLFTGEANGMGGSLVLNPKGRHYEELQELQDEEYEDNFFDPNAIFLERNSRDFVQRSRRIDTNAEGLVKMLNEAKENTHSHILKNVYHPTLQTRENYDQCKRLQGGYGGLFSLTFHSMRQAMAFYDALHCAKGPSLGTNFTLASPFVILAHYTELDWAAQFGVEAKLVRVSVGLEDKESLLQMFNYALQAASVV
ncbi:hypothetical protein L7F22_003086 [Adiantum nelumboides]|nr:hypothetical protein [Adiantum nelumboides]